MPTPLELQPYGPDLSHHNGNVDFGKVQRAGASFVILKATQGTAFLDPSFRPNFQRARATGLIVGSYHYLSYEHPPRQQANFYVNAVGEVSPGEIFPIVDIENDDDDPETNKQYTPEYMLHYASEFIDEVHRLTEKWPMIYTYVSFWKDTLHNVQNWKDKCPLWIADYRAKRPELVGGWLYHTFHQYTSTGRINGVPGVCDMNRFNGSLDRLKVLAGG